MNSTSTYGWFPRFMASAAGRWARAGLGVSLGAIGLGLLAPPGGLVLAALGLVPIAAGVFNICPVAPVWGGHFFGARYCEVKERTH